MRPHNHWKLRQLQKAIIKIVLWGFGFALLFVTLVLKIPLGYNVLSEIISIVSIALGCSLTLVERVLWKTPIMKLPILENYWTPVLKGRWEGTLVRDKKPHKFVMEIKQSFTSISCTTYSRHSSSSAYATEILYNDLLKTYKLIHYWHGGTTAVQDGTGDTNTFEGFTVLDIIIQSGKVKKLTGSYFTNRQPKQTRGTLDLEFRQKDLKNSFE